MTANNKVKTIYAATTLSPAPRWVMGVNDLTQGVRAKTYMVDGRIVTLANRKRQVVDTLLRSPVYCASTIRISDIVFRLKSEDGIGISTETGVTGRKYYSLKSKVLA